MEIVSLRGRSPRRLCSCCRTCRCWSAPSRSLEGLASPHEPSTPAPQVGRFSKLRRVPLLAGRLPARPGVGPLHPAADSSIRDVGGSSSATWVFLRHRDPKDLSVACFSW